MRLLLGCAIVCAAVGLRIAIITLFPSVVLWITERVEVSTPENSCAQAVEGKFLHDHGLTPYDGDVYHQSPLLLWLLRCLLDCSTSAHAAFFIAADVLTAICLAGFAASDCTIRVMEDAKIRKDTAENAKSFLMTKSSVGSVPYLVLLTYLFNPYTLASSLAQTSTSLNNAVLALLLSMTVKKSSTAASFLLAVAINHSVYSVVLFAPMILYFDKDVIATERVGELLLRVLGRLTLVSCMLAVLIYIQFLLLGDWSFLQGTYGFLLSVPDLTPTVGLFWYFFTEMFEHFRLFFTCVFQLNILVYVLPLSVKLRHEPFLVMHMLLILISVFKPYPSVGDAALHLALLPLCSHLFSFLRHGFMVFCVIASVSCLSPVMWYLWIYAGSANANFYFAVTLLYCVAFIFLMTDLLFAALRRKVYLKHGLNPQINGKPAVLAVKW